MSRTKNRTSLTTIVSWLPLIVLPILAFELATPRFPRWLFMWALALSIYVGLKWLSWFEDAAREVPAWKHVGYLFAWPGMDARSFLGNGLKADPPGFCEWLIAAAKVVVGAVLIVVGIRRSGNGFDLVAGWLEMIGLILLLHCGLFHLLSCLWRTLGVEARPIMNSPLLATSIADFWGRRWNLAFRDLTHRFVVRPLVARYGPTIGLWLGFLVSGVIHELVITIPAQGGYGGPTLYFLLQALAIFTERSRLGRRIGLGRGWLGRTYAAFVLIVPVGLLLPPAFVREIVVPFCRDF